MSAIKSPLRYPGGKTKAINKILPFIPSSFSEYREPFLGGGSVFLAVKQRNPDAMFRINDLNSDVYCFWSVLKDRPARLISAITEIRNNFDDGKTLHLRLAHSRPLGVFGRALRYYLLNRITYSGIADSGGSRESFEKRFTLSKILGLYSLAELLKNVKITNESYEQLLSAPGGNVFIFLDPPYWSARKSSLYGENGNLNKFFDHKKFAENIRKCPHKWLITCDDSDVIRELFSFAKIYPWELKYNGLNKKSAIIGKELFITNYEPPNTMSQFKLACPNISQLTSVFKAPVIETSVGQR